MANYAHTKEIIAQNIYTNHLGQVTAEMVKTAANEIVKALIDGGYLYAGVAKLTPTQTNPGSPDANVFYIATEPGTYTNFVGADGSLVVADGEVAIFKFNGTWSKEVTGAATAAQVTELGQKIVYIVGKGTVGGGDTGVTGNGQYFIYQTTGDLAKSRDYTDSSHFNYDVVDWRKDAVYIFSGDLQVWDGTQLVDKTPTTPDIVNPNSITGTASYDNELQAVSAIPITLRKKGLIVTYCMGDEWNIIQFDGSDVISDWTVYDKWRHFKGVTKNQYIEIINNLSAIGVDNLPMTDEGYIVTNGTVVDVTTIAGGNAWRHKVIDCAKGDRFTVYGASGSGPRLWCFIDNEYNVLSVAPGYASNTVITDYITAPDNAAKLIVNAATHLEHGIYTNFSQEKVQDDLYATKKKVDGAIFTISECETISGYVGADGKWGYVGNSGTLAYLIPVNGGDGVKIAAPSTPDAQYFAFLRSKPTNISNGTVADLSHEDGFTKTFVASVGMAAYKVPSDAKYLLVSSKINGSDRLPSSIVVNFYDVVTGKNTQDKIFGGLSGAFTTALTKASKLICTIIDDDAQTTLSMNALQDVMEDSDINLRCTVASLTDKWNPENQDEPFYDAALKQKLYDMELSGYQIVLHAYKQDGNNEWLDIDTRFAEYEANFVKGLRDLHQAGFSNCDFWVTPGGIGGENAQKLARKYGMNAMVIGVNGINLPSAYNTITGKQTGNLNGWVNERWRVRRANLRHEDDIDWTLQDLKDLAERGSHHGAWLVLCTHAYQWADNASNKAAFKSRLAEFKTYAEGLGYEFMTLGEAWTYKRAIYDVIDMM